MEPVYGEPAAVVEDTLVVSDLHVGLEVKLRRDGVEVPSRASEKRERLLELVESTGASRVVLNGDAKHNVPFTSRQESRELSEILRDLSRVAEVTVVRGNHDGGIDDLAPDDVELADPGGLLLGDVGVLHGHASPREELRGADAWLVGHTHPKVVLRESNGATVSRQAWLRFRGEREVVVMPAFEWWGGSDAAADGLLGPLEYPGDPEVTLLDGTRLGRLGEIEGVEQ